MRPFKRMEILLLIVVIVTSTVSVAWVLVGRHRRSQQIVGLLQRIAAVERSADAATEAEAIDELNRWTQQQHVLYIMSARRADNHQTISFSEQDIGRVDANVELELVFADVAMRELHRWRYSPKSNRNVYILLHE